MVSLNISWQTPINHTKDMSRIELMHNKMHRIKQFWRRNSPLNLIQARQCRRSWGCGSASPSKTFLGKFGWTWAKLGRNLGKSD